MADDPEDDFDCDDGCDGELDDECGLDDDGQCAFAGTEHCDFECIYRDSELFAGSKAWREKHRRKRKNDDLQLPLIPTKDPEQ